MSQVGEPVKKITVIPKEEPIPQEPVAVPEKEPVAIPEKVTV